MPEPMISPTMSDNPFRNVNVLCFSNEPPPSPPFGLAADVGAPIGAYPSPPVVELRGNRFGVKSNAEDTEYVRPCIPRPATFPVSKGSSCSSDSLREDEMLGLDEISDIASSLSWLELASDASSSESRVCDGTPSCGIATIRSSSLALSLAVNQATTVFQSDDPATSSDSP